MSSARTTDPPDNLLLEDGAKLAGWFHRLEDNRLECELCPRRCQLRPGDRGFCFVRENRDDQMVLSTYGRSTGFCIDPIEKKPLNHFLPGTPVLSFGTAGCNLGCKFCQNWEISKSKTVARLSELASPDRIAKAAKELGCQSVAMTYNDPVIWAEYAIDTAKACQRAGLKTIAVTAGYIEPAARARFFEVMDATNIDFKAITEDFYWKLTSSHLQPVLDTLKWVYHETDTWLELTNLVIPAANDRPSEIRSLCEWIVSELGPEVPLHFSAFHPDFRMQDRPATPHATLISAYETARDCGLQFVYLGNVHDASRESTMCPSCSRILIERDWYVLGEYNLNGNHCQFCGTEIPGHFAEGPGHWGNRRQAINISAFAQT